MKRVTKVLLTAFMLCASVFAQSDVSKHGDFPSINIGRARVTADFDGPVAMNHRLDHPYHVEAWHSDGTKFYDYEGVNLRTSAGTTWEAELMGKVTTPTVNAQCNWIALTNTAVTPAEADTTLSGEIVSNGLTRSQATFTNSSTTLSVASAPTLVVTGGSGGTAQFYFVEVCNQGICTTPSAASASGTPNATLDATHYITGTFTGQNGASSYVIIRSNSGSAPSGSLTGGATQASTGQVVNASVFCTAALSCTFVDNSNTVAAYVVPGSNLTNFGKYTLVFTWTATATQAAQAFGVLSASSSGTLCFEGVFTPVSLNTNDTFQLTETVYF